MFWWCRWWWWEWLCDCMCLFLGEVICCLMDCRLEIVDELELFVDLWIIIFILWCVWILVVLVFFIILLYFIKGIIVLCCVCFMCEILLVSWIEDVEFFIFFLWDLLFSVLFVFLLKEWWDLILVVDWFGWMWGWLILLFLFDGLLCCFKVFKI